MENAMDERNWQDRFFLEQKDHNQFESTLGKALEYMDGISNREVFPFQEKLQALEQFGEPLPEKGESLENLMDLLDRIGSPATVAQTGGRYFGFVCGAALPAGLAAKTLATFWDQNGGMHVLSPVTSKLESVVERWIREALRLPRDFVCGFLSGSSLATFCGLAAGRYRILKNLGWDIPTQGLIKAPPIRIVTGEHAHSTVIKAINLLGLGTNNIEFVPVDDQGRIDVDKIPEPDNTTLLILQAGNVNSGSFDDFTAICGKAKEIGAWIHIDGAFGLWTRATENLSHLTEGIELANSLSVDGHKTLNTPYDNGILLCSDEEALKSALHMSGSYIPESKERSGMYYTPLMSQRARAIEIWAVMKSLGKEGVGDLVEHLHQKALLFAEEISQIEGFSVLNEVSFNQVLLACEDDDLTEKTMKRVQELGTCWAGGSQWFGRKVIRISVSSWATTEEDIRVSAQSFAEALKQIREEEK